MFCHYVSALTEFIVLNVGNEDNARCDPTSKGLFGVLVTWYIIWPFLYGGLFYYQYIEENVYLYSLWGYKVASVFLDAFVLAYTIYVKKAL